jgi:hypothetical protein
MLNIHFKINKAQSYSLNVNLFKRTKFRFFGQNFNSNVHNTITGIDDLNFKILNKVNDISAITKAFQNSMTTLISELNELHILYKKTITNEKMVSYPSIESSLSSNYNNII